MKGVYEWEIGSTTATIQGNKRFVGTVSELAVGQ
jgi:hypothetical protein